MRKFVKVGLILIGSVVLLAVLFTGFYEIHDFLPYVASMRAIYSGMPVEDREPPQNVQDFVWTVEGEAINSFDARCLLAETKHPQGMFGWHFHSAMWTVLLTLHFSKRERTAFYCHYLPYENGLGFSNASQFYFGKLPEKINTDEIAAIIAIGRSPRGNSPTRHPDRFETAKQRVLGIYASRQ